MRISDWSSDVCSSDLAEHVGAQMMYDQIVDVDLSERPFRLKGDSGTLYYADSLVIATGAQAKWLGAKGEQLLQGKRSEEHTSELQSLMRISYAVFCLKKKTYHRKPRL